MNDTAAHLAIEKIQAHIYLTSDMNRVKKERIGSLTEIFRILLTDPGKIICCHSPRMRASIMSKIDEFTSDEDVQQNLHLMGMIDEVWEIITALENGQEIQF